MFLEKATFGSRVQINIESRDELHTYFSIDQLYDGIICNPARFNSYRLFCQSIKPTVNVDAELLGRLCEQNGRRVYVFKKTPRWFAGGKADVDGLLAALEPFAGPLDFLEFCEQQDNEDLIRELAKTVSFEEEAALLFLFMLLHIQAMRLIRPQDLPFMRERLEDARRAVLLPRKPVPLPLGTTRHSLERCAPGAPEIRVFTGGWIPLSVRLKDTPFSRTLFEGDTLLVLASGGRYPIFFPRNRAFDDVSSTHYARLLLRSLESLPASDPNDAIAANDPVIAPILCGGACALCLTRSGRAVADGREVAKDVRCAAADDAFFYFGREDGVWRLPRCGGEMKHLFKTCAAVEEIGVADNTISWRRADTSERFCMPVPPQEG